LELAAEEEGVGEGLDDLDVGGVRGGAGDAEASAGETLFAKFLSWSTSQLGGRLCGRSGALYQAEPLIHSNLSGHRSGNNPS